MRQSGQGVVPGLDAEDVLFRVVINKCVSKSLADISQARDQEQKSLIISMAVIARYPLKPRTWYPQVVKLRLMTSKRYTSSSK